MENVTSLVTTNFGAKHVSIADQFRARIIKMLESAEIETKTYGIDTETYSGETESIKLVLGDRLFLTIQVVTRKS